MAQKNDVTLPGCGIVDTVDLSNCTREGLIEIINMHEQIIEEEDRPYHKT